MSNLIRDVLSRARLHLERGDLDDAERMYRAVLAQSPESPQALEGLRLLTRRRSEAQEQDGPLIEASIQELIHFGKVANSAAKLVDGWDRVKA